MRYVESPAPPDLALHVRRFWSLQDAPLDAAGAIVRPIERVVPDGRMELLVHLGDRFAQLAQDRRTGKLAAPCRQPRALLAGQLDAPLFLLAGRAIDLFAIRFEPWGAAALLGLDAAELQGRLLPLDDVVGTPAAEELVDALAAAGPAQRLAVACRWLRERAARASARARDPAWLRAVVQAAQREPQQHDVTSLAALAGRGRREIERRFARHVGIAPKTFLRVARVQRTLAALEAEAPPELAALALRFGYCDQGHFTRDFGDVTGTTPARWRRERHGLETLLLDPAPPVAGVSARA